MSIARLVSASAFSSPAAVPASFYSFKRACFVSHAASVVSSPAVVVPASGYHSLFESHVKSHHPTLSTVANTSHICIIGHVWAASFSVITADVSGSVAGPGSATRVALVSCETVTVGISRGTFSGTSTISFEVVVFPLVPTSSGPTLVPS